jgi:uncharacterized repeat protein (TIGR01451 family)
MLAALRGACAWLASRVYPGSATRVFERGPSGRDGSRRRLAAKVSLTTGLALVIGLPGWSAAQPDGLQQRGDADVAGTACTSTLYLSQLQGNPNTTLFEVNTRVSPLVFDPLGSGSHLYNAIGFNPVDNQLYAMNTGGSAALNMLLQVASNGATTELGLVSGLPAVAYNSGTVGSDGVYYVKPFGNTNVVYAIDLVARTATAISLSTSFTASDMGWVGGAGGSLYSVSDSGQLYSISASGTVTAIGPATGGGVLGAQFGAVNGLFGSSNDGGLFRIDLTTGARSLISGSPASGSNDGANCPNAPVQLAADLSVTKTSPTTTYAPGASVSYTILVRNEGPFAAEDVTVDDPLPAGISAASWTCSGSGGGVCGVASGTGAISDADVVLPAGGSVTYALTLQVPPGFTGPLVNTASVLPGIGTFDPDSSNDSDSVTHEPEGTGPTPTPAPACGMSAIETFGSTTTAPTIGSPGGPWGPPLSGTEGTTEYTYRGSWQIVEGEYARVVSPASGGNPSAWVDAGDHTADPAGAYGYMLIIDSSDAPGVFYSKTFVGLQIGARYTMSAAIANIVGAGNLILPNVQMRVVDAVTGSVIGQNSTGPLPQAASLTGPLSWSNPELSFDATTTSVRIELVNFQANAGSGNDLAVDDVGLRRDCVTLVKALTSESGGVTGTAEPGETLVYTITLSNSGVGAFTDYTFDENVPLGATLTGIGGAGVSLGCTLPLTGNASCPVTVASVPAGGSTAVSVTFAIADPIPSGVANIVNSVSGGHTDCGAAGNVCSVTTPVAGGSVVALTKTVTDASGNGIAEPGETLTYQITLTNTGSSAATGYDVTDQLDPNSSFVSATNGGAHAAGIITWTGLTVPAQVGATPGTLVLTVAVTVNTPIPSGVTRIVNQAMPTGTAPPTCSATPTPAGCAIVPTPSNVRLVKVLSGENGDRPGLAEPGETLTYTITLTDLGGGGFPNYAFVENVPLGATLTAVSGAGVTTGCGLPVTGAGSCPVTVASVPAGGSTTILVTFVVSDPIPAGVTSIVNTVNQGDTGCAEAGNACSVSTAIAGGAPPDVVPVPVNSRLGLLLLALAILAVAGLYRNGQRFER